MHVLGKNITHVGEYMPDQQYPDESCLNQLLLMFTCSALPTEHTCIQANRSSLSLIDLYLYSMRSILLPTITNQPGTSSNNIISG